MKCHLPGQSGEVGCFQFLPATFNGYAKDVLGYIPEMTDENQEQVALLKIEQWLEDGLTPKEIFLIWNTGRNQGCSSGYNKHGVFFDSCAYVEKTFNNLNYLKSL